jgi:DNA polymerase
MRTLILDGETFYSKEYTLRTMTPAEYILDDRFELTGLAVKELGMQPYWIEGPDAAAFFASLDPDETTTISHNALFDNCIWSYRYGFVPKLMVCTLGMARSLLNIRSNSLAAVAKYYKLPEEKGSEIHQAIGMNLAQLQGNPQFYRNYQEYALKDARLCEAIYAKMAPHFPEDEYFIQDLVLRAAVQPVLHADTNLLASHLEVLRKRKARLLRESNYDRANLMSTPQFQAALEELGVVVKTKLSPAGREVPAFAKTDPFMEELQEYHDGPNDDINYRVQVLASARLAHKSTIEETRAERFLNIARLPWGSHQPLLPVPLRYGGAHTHRLSGEWRMNLQNLPRDKTKSNLRSALVAPAGFKIVAADLSQIEARIVACLAGEMELIERFRNGEDVYAWFASKLFGYPVNKKDNPNERFIGKTAILGLGYGCGANRFFQMVTAQARQYGIDLKGLFSIEVAQRAVDFYRATFPLIAGSWNALERLRIKVLCNEKNAPAEFGPVEVSYGRIRLPSGMYLRYEVPDQTLYGAKLLENITQALARIIIMDAALRLEEWGYRFVLQAHDELAFVVRDADVEEAKKIILREMLHPPGWMLDLPLAAEIGVGQNYGEVK